MIKPGPKTIPLPSDNVINQTIPSTPIYPSPPTLDEWDFQDQLARGHITLNCTDVTGLGVVTTGTAKDSIQMEWGRSTNMRHSHAQEALNWTIYAEGTEIQDHIKPLWTWKAAVDNLSTSAMSNEAWRGIIIWSIPPMLKWLLLGFELSSVIVDSLSFKRGSKVESDYRESSSIAGWLL